MVMPAALHTLAKVPSAGSLEDALADALSGNPFNDMIFYASREDGCEPRVVYANSRILTSASEYFRELLAEEKGSECDTAFTSKASSRLPNGALEEDDSMLVDGDDIDSVAVESLLTTPSEISLGDDEVMKLPDSVSEDTRNVSPVASVASGPRVIRLDNVTSDTLQTTIFYIYTGKASFLPLRSALSKAQVNHAQVERSNRPACSCKAAYRFAEEAGLDELKQLAEDHLFAQLDAANILDEVFSPFSSQHPVILRRQVDMLLEKYWTPATRGALGQMMERIVRGDLPHAAPVLRMLLGEIPARTRPEALAADCSREEPKLEAQPPTCPPSTEPSSAQFSPTSTSPVEEPLAAGEPASLESAPKSGSTDDQSAPSPSATAAVGTVGAPAASASAPSQSSSVSSTNQHELRSADANAGVPTSIPGAQPSAAHSPAIHSAVTAEAQPVHPVSHASPAAPEPAERVECANAPPKIAEPRPADASPPQPPSPVAKPAVEGTLGSGAVAGTSASARAAAHPPVAVRPGMLRARAPVRYTSFYGGSRSGTSTEGGAPAGGQGVSATGRLASLFQQNGFRRSHSESGEESEDLVDEHAEVARPPLSKSEKKSLRKKAKKGSSIIAARRVEARDGGAEGCSAAADAQQRTSTW